LILAASFASACALLSSCAAVRGSIEVSPAKPPVVTAPALEDVPSTAAVREMGLGWNLGNTMEACGDWIKGWDVVNFETAWGNPETTKAMIGRIRKVGFRSVRIPVAWSNLMRAGNRIEPALLDRVRQIVDWVLEEGMVAVVNIHWDGGWWSKFPIEYEKSMERYRRIWTQVAGKFRDYPCSLVFESLNEEGCFGDVWNRWGGGTAEQKQRAFGILNDINQAFVDLVRASGGLNARRHLLIAGYCTDIDLTVDPLFAMPKDPQGRLIASVHYYTPYTFAGLEKDESWGKMRATWGTPEDYKELDTLMGKLKPRFLDQGIPVIVGEFGATTKKEPESVRRYIQAVAGKVYGMGMCPMLWDPGTHFNRRTLEFNDPSLEEGFRALGRTKRE
jgi:endoglucanase